MLNKLLFLQFVVTGSVSVQIFLDLLIFNMETTSAPLKFSGHYAFAVILKTLFAD
jgi:hypothetical protein